MATCDPAVGLLASRLARQAEVRLIAFGRSSRAALALLGKGLIHVAGVHLSAEGHADGNATAVREMLGPGFCLLRVGRWEEGIVSAPGSKRISVRKAVQSKHRWVGREVGSGARQCLDEIRHGQPPPNRLAADHRGVAEAVRSGWADLGVCLRLAGEEAGLDFLPVREESYDLCFPESSKDDPRIRALIEVVRSASFRRSIADLPGYKPVEIGETRSVS